MLRVRASSSQPHRRDYLPFGQVIGQPIEPDQRQSRPECGVQTGGSGGVQAKNARDECEDIAKDGVERISGQMQHAPHVERDLGFAHINHIGVG